jgi:RNA polymerase sigma-70 factor (ECF subfamily)
VSDSAPGQAGSGIVEGGLVLLLSQHRAELLRFLRARTGEPSEAEDILQDLWLRLQTQRRGPVSNGRAYLFQMANHLVLDRVRERRRRARRDQQWTESVQSQDTVAGEPVAPEPEPSQALIEQEELRRLEAAIATLPERAREAFRLHKVEGCSHADVAARLGISRSGVEKHIAVAMRHLRQALLG